MWQQITLNQPDVLRRVNEIVHSCNVPAPFLNVPSMIAEDEQDLKQGRTFIYRYEQGAFELVLQFTEDARRKIYKLCCAVAGNVAARDALDLLVDQAMMWAQARRIPRVYIIQPKIFASSLMQEMADLLPAHPRVRRALVSEMGDAWAYLLDAR